MRMLGKMLVPFVCVLAVLPAGAGASDEQRRPPPFDAGWACSSVREVVIHVRYGPSVVVSPYWSECQWDSAAREGYLVGSTSGVAVTVGECAILGICSPGVAVKPPTTAYSVVNAVAASATFTAAAQVEGASAGGACIYVLDGPAVLARSCRFDTVPHARLLVSTPATQGQELQIWVGIHSPGVMRVSEIAYS